METGLGGARLIATVAQVFYMQSIGQAVFSKGPVVDTECSRDRELEEETKKVQNPSIWGTHMCAYVGW